MLKVPRSRDEITIKENLGFEVQYEGEDLVLEEERTFVFV